MQAQNDKQSTENLLQSQNNTSDQIPDKIQCNAKSNIKWSDSSYSDVDLTSDSDSDDKCYFVPDSKPSVQLKNTIQSKSIPQELVVADPPVFENVIEQIRVTNKRYQYFLRNFTYTAINLPSFTKYAYFL